MVPAAAVEIVTSAANLVAQLGEGGSDLIDRPMGGRGEVNGKRMKRWPSMPDFKKKTSRFRSKRARRPGRRWPRRMMPCLCNGFLQLASFKVREGDRKLREKGIRRIIAHGLNNRFELSVGGLRRKELDEKEIVSAGSDVKRVLAGLIFGA